MNKKLNLYRAWLKAHCMRRAARDYKDSAKVMGFTRKDFFYYFIDNGVKWIHLYSLEAVYTNGMTYSDKQETPDHCIINAKKESSINFKEIKEYIITSGDLLPEVVESENNKFLKYEVFEGNPLTSVDKEQYYNLKDLDKTEQYTAFYNSMCYNIVEKDGVLKLIDLKHFEKRILLPFFIYMNNDDIGVNDLYIEEGMGRESIDRILKHLNTDYVVKDDDIRWIKKR